MPEKDTYRRFEIHSRVGWMGSVHAVGCGDSLIGKQATEAWQWLENGGDRVTERTGAPQLWQN